ncbi:MAG: hypothetical protein ACJAYN_002927 [Bermanella sp.]|jgi:hypothetical protein|uniref:hypothetical protein n=1 Tax=Glaciecola sp. 33A TaxID=2057807 RepID=UPI000C34EDD2|nr:hypothetical protein [Glaciecola sp. 33A]PKI03199.1 hypothetical protein CXF81_03285 [Glaciecola sp. 33A]
MKYTLLVVGLLFAASTIADERPVADAQLIKEYKEYCKEIADDEGTGKLSMDEFLLVCVNEELETEGYQPITKLPK